MSDPRLLNRDGMAALSRGDHAAARDLFAAAAALDPRAAQLWANLATAARALGDDEGEERALLAALGVEQRQFMVQVRLAELYARTDRAARAAKHWSAVVSLGAQLPTRSAETDAIVARAGAFVRERSAAFADAVERELAGTRGSLPAADRRRFDACLDAMLGRRRIYQNQCDGLHYPFLPADEYFDRALFPWMPALEARTDAIRAELEGLLADGGAGFAPYVQMEGGTPDNVWTKLDRSLDWSALHLFRHGVRDEAVATRCPETVAALSDVPQADVPRRSPTAFFSVLKPRTHIPAHTGVTNTRATVHLPLVVPDGCRFRVGGETRAWRVSEAFAFDDTIEHEAWNDSDQVRAVLIFDVWNPHLRGVERQLLRAFFVAADASGHDPGMLDE